MKKFFTLVCAVLGISATMMAQTTEPETTTTTKSLDMGALVDAANYTSGEVALTQDMFTDDNAFITLGSGTNTLKSTTYFEGKGEVFSVTLATSGSISIELSSTGTFNHTSFALADGDGEYLTLSTNIDDNEYVLGPGTTITDDGQDEQKAQKTGNVNVTLVDGEYAIYTSGNEQVVTYEVAEAGTYTFSTNILASDPFGRGARIYGITVEEGTTTEVNPDEETIYSGSTTGTVASAGWQEIEITETDLFGNIDPTEATYIEFSGDVVEVHYTGVANGYTSIAVNGDGVAVVDATDIVTSDNGGTYYLVVVVSLEEGARYNIYWTVHTAEYVAEDEDTKTEIDGYLTVTVGGAEVDANEEVTITVTEDADGKVTIDLGNLAVSIVTISDASVTFTPDEDGKYESGEVNGTVTILNTNTPTELTGVTATGSYVVDEDGETTFTASFTYTVLSLDLVIAVSFTTVAPVAEPEYGWTLITDEFDENQYSKNNCVKLSLAELQAAGYTAIKVEATLDPDAVTFGSYGALCIDDSWNKLAIDDVTAIDGDEKDNFACDLRASSAEFEVELDVIEEGLSGEDTFYLVFWADCVSVKVYGYSEISEDTESGTEEGNEETIEDFVLPIVDLFNAGSVSDWGSSTTAVVDATGKALVLEFTQASWGSYVFNNWSSWDLSDYNTAIMTYSFDDAFAASGNYAQLMIEDNNAYIVSDNDNNIDRGVVTVDLSSDATIDLTNVQQIAVQTALAGTITVEEIRFTVKSTTGDIEGDDDTDTAISNVNVEAVEVARYNLIGQKLAGAEKGINIIVYSDGSAKKVLVK